MTTRDVEKRRATWRKYYKNTYSQKPPDDPVKMKRRAWYKAWVAGRKEQVYGYQISYKNRHKLRTLVRLARIRSLRNGTPFDEQYMKSFIGLRPSHCAACNVLMDYSSKGNGNRCPIRAPSLDRVITERGYISGNVAVICWRCNTIKRDASAQELEAIAAYIRGHK